jgi:hypothetical protein
MTCENNTLRMVYEPLGEWVGHRAWCEYAYDHEAEEWGYRATAPVTFRFPAYHARFKTLGGPHWRTLASGSIEVDVGFKFAPSGPAIDDESSVVGSCVHDILCHPVIDRGRVVYPCSYMRAHRLYRLINRAQGQHWCRSWYQWAALVACNWIVRLDDKATAVQMG